MNDKKSAGYIIGSILGTVLVTCVAVCIGGIAVALTAKFLLWLF